MTKNKGRTLLAACFFGSSRNFTTNLEEIGILYEKKANGD